MRYATEVGTSDVLLWTPTHGHTSAGRLAETYIHQLCANTECSLEDLPGVMSNMDGWMERERESQVQSKKESKNT